MKIEQNPHGSNGLTMLTCSHGEAYNIRRAQGKLDGAPLNGAAPATHFLELEPAVIFNCCGMCAAFIRENALRNLIRDGVKVTLSTGKPRIDVDDAFVRLMELRLQQNAARGEWSDYSPSELEAFCALHGQTDKLHAALIDTPNANRDRAKISQLCADVANYAMKIAERYGKEGVC